MNNMIYSQHNLSNNSVQKIKVNTQARDSQKLEFALKTAQNSTQVNSIVAIRIHVLNSKLFTVIINLHGKRSLSIVPN